MLVFDHSDYERRSAQSCALKTHRLNRPEHEQRIEHDRYDDHGDQRAPVAQNVDQFFRIDRPYSAGEAHFRWQPVEKSVAPVSSR